MTYNRSECESNSARNEIQTGILFQIMYSSCKQLTIGRMAGVRIQLEIQWPATTGSHCVQAIPPKANYDYWHPTIFDQVRHVGYSRLTNCLFGADTVIALFVYGRIASSFHTFPQAQPPNEAEPAAGPSHAHTS